MGKTVLVTGAGGSIGSEIVKQCRRLGANRIVKVDNDESALFNLSLSLFGHALFNEDSDLHLVDISNELAISKLIGEVKPDIVFHAAAKKHLSLVEAQPEMAIRVNVFGTLSVIKASVAHAVPRFVNISTDKAANPSSVLGWSKRIAELIGAHYTTPFTNITSVRFGNVLGSNGSLLPIIQHKLETGKAIQVTHPEVTRYFMTIPEATGLVIEAANLSMGGEVFILDMGMPVKIVDVIRDYARLAGNKVPEIEFIGLRAGEKLHEELFADSEQHTSTAHPRIKMALVHDNTDVGAKLNELSDLLSVQTECSELKNALTLTRKDFHVVPTRTPAPPTVLGTR